MNCQLCNKPTNSFLHKKTDITYYHCTECEYIFKSPENYQNFALQKERYNLHENDANSKSYQEYFRRFLDFVLPLVGQPEDALDFGCGRSSLLASLLEKEGISCDYYDPIYYPTALDDEKKYDLIVSTEVFEHLHQPRDTFESLVKRLNRGGYLAIQTQFHPNNVEAFKKWYYHQDPTHIVFFTAHTFHLLAKKYHCRFIQENHKNMVVLQKN